MSRIADFRSDTVTRPTREMLEAMARAEVGDDVLGDDPTVRRLEEMAAERLGKEEAVFVPSGTMGNQASIAAQTRPGDEVILEEDSHCIHYESGGLGRIASVQVRTLKGRRGAMDPAEVERAIRPPIAYLPRTSLVVVEQTHMNAGGCVLPLENLLAIREIARKRGLRVHMDGARIFNASAASGIPPSRYAAQADSVTFCLSKGLSCPVGSLVCGDGNFVSEARRLRKCLGGGMRQAGYLAACGIYALTHLVERLADDHARAKRLAQGLGNLRGLSVDNLEVESNIVFVSVRVPGLDAPKVQALLESEGVRAIALGPDRMRFVTHREIEDADVERAIAAAKRIVGGGR